DDFGKLEREIKFKQEDAKTRYDRRYQTVVGPIYGDIMKAMQDFAKQKGYAVILDGAKLEEAGILMAFDDRYNVTSEFIQFYNTRPAGTASAATPK
ncbi:MAG: outer membrane protein, partial [Acidobacteria bacterium]|nr:outer membrane protein [Acidobacteriota bacterium]